MNSSTSTTPNRLRSYSLFDALLHRRSRRFFKGASLNGGPLAYQSQQPHQPLNIQEEAALAFAASGLTGPVLAELPYESGTLANAGGGNIMKQFLGRTAPSADALHAVTVFLTNDSGTWMLRRPQDYPPADVTAAVADAHAGRLTDWFARARISISDSRTDVPRELPFVPPFNKWSANLPGSTYFVPVNELTSLYLNILLSALGDDFNYFIVDDRNGFRPAGIGRFAQSKGGKLHDNPCDGRFMTVTFLESWLFELAAVEQGAIVQNLGLMAQALGIGGFPHFAAHPFGWMQALGFRMEQPRFSQCVAAGPVMKCALRLLKKDIPLPTAVGLEHDQHVLLRPFCPPYYKSMREAVLAFVESKFAAGKGAFRDPSAATAWKDPNAVQQRIPEYSAQAIEATIAYCEYVYARYGRFPAACGPFRTVLGYQAHNLDDDFYRRFYRDGSWQGDQRE